MKSSVDLACYGVSRAKDWVSVDCGTNSKDIAIFNKYIYRDLYFKENTGNSV